MAESQVAEPKVAGKRVWVCVACGYRYDEAVGDPDGDVPPGTAWEDIPDDWMCPECGIRKSAFDMRIEA